MADLVYEPANELGPLKVGDSVEVLDSRGAVVGSQKIRQIGRLSVTTTCGRAWTKSHGEWVSEFRFNKPISWPFPSIRKAGVASAQGGGCP